MVQSAGKNATRLLTIHWEPPCINACVIAFATSSGFIVCSSLVLIYSPRLTREPVVLLRRSKGDRLASPLPIVSNRAEKNLLPCGRWGLRLGLASCSQYIDSGNGSHHGQQDHRGVGNTDGPTHIGVGDQELADSQQWACCNRNGLNAKDVGNKVEERAQTKQPRHKTKITQVVIRVPYQFHQ